MKALRITLTVLAGLALVLLTLNSEQLTATALEAWQFGWMDAFLLPRILLLVLTIAMLVALLPILNIPRVRKWLLGIVIITASVGGYLAVNLPYIDDWSREGETLDSSLDGNQIETQLNSIQPDYDGLVFLVLPNCPYCFDAFPNVVRLKERNPDLDVSIFVSAMDSSKFRFFTEHIPDTDLPIHMISDHKEATALSNGKFPTFLYFRDGRVFYRWSNNQFGYPALDWIESGLE
jgi:thiol-disulfide isomerase/thioredoxin